MQEGKQPSLLAHFPPPERLDMSRLCDVICDHFLRLPQPVLFGVFAWIALPIRRNSRWKAALVKRDDRPSIDAMTSSGGANVSRQRIESLTFPQIWEETWFPSFIKRTTFLPRSERRLSSSAVLWLHPGYRSHVESLSSSS